jgi:hypothetical protein
VQFSVGELQACSAVGQADAAMHSLNQYTSTGDTLVDCLRVLIWAAWSTVGTSAVAHKSDATKSRTVPGFISRISSIRMDVCDVLLPDQLISCCITSV